MWKGLDKVAICIIINLGPSHHKWGARGTLLFLSTWVAPRDQLMHHPPGSCPGGMRGGPSGSVLSDCSCWQGTEVIFTLTKYICPSLGQPLLRENWGVESKTFHRAKEQWTAHTARKRPKWLTHVCPVRLNTGVQHGPVHRPHIYLLLFVFHRQTSVNGHILLMKRRRLRVHLGVNRRAFLRQHKFLYLFRKTMFSSIKNPKALSWAP